MTTINTDQQLYVLHHDGYISCLGFDVAFKRASKVAAWAGCAPPDPALTGTPEGYADYLRVMHAGATKHTETRERCYAELDPMLAGLEGKRVQATDTYGNTRRFWVGMSTGWLPCHLEIHNTRSTGGPAAMGPFTSVRVIR